VVDITSLVVDCGDVRIPFKTRHHTFIQAVSEVDDTCTIWLGSPVSVEVHEKKHVLSARLRCHKVYCDIRQGISLIFEGQNDEGTPRIVPHSLRYTVEMDMEKPR
jgi:hypothetical protein